MTPCLCGISIVDMKRFCLSALAIALLLGCLPPLWAQNDGAPPAPAPATDQDQKTIDKHSKPILDTLNLNNPDKEAKVKQIVGEQIKALNAWHAQNDPQIKALWGEFIQSRSKTNEAGADAALAKIDTIYAAFKPQHDKFIQALWSVLTPDQIESVKDALTVNKVKVTFNAYGQIFHGLTEEQKAFILKNLKAAREEAIDAGAMTEKSAFFKKYKIKIEAYLTAQGYDVKQSYKNFVEKQKADTKKSAPLAGEDK